MISDYTHYKADQLLNDEFFIQSELHPTTESMAFWRIMENRNDSLTKEIRLARSFLRYIRENSENMVMPYKDEKDLWERIQRENRKYDNKRILYFSMIATAAAAFALFFVLNKEAEMPVHEKQADYMAIIESAKAAEDDSGNIQLLLSDNKTLNLQGKESQIEYEKEGEIRVNSEKVLIADEDKNKDQYLNTLIVPVGKRSNVTLSDGTKMWVNSDTKVIYPVQFSSNKREIFVEGEIYLDVIHNENAPFIVKTRDTQIRVLGTQFNVTAYKDEPEMNIILVNGKVEIELPGNKKNIISPNEMISYDKENDTSEIVKVNVIDYVAWKDGYYHFNKEPMNTLLQKLSRYYGVEIIWDRYVGDLICSGKFDLKDDFKEVLNLLSKAAPIQIETTDKQVIIKATPEVVMD